MADDPVTLTLNTSWTIVPGLKAAVFTVVGPADYDESGGAACDLSTWFDDVYAVIPCGLADDQADSFVKIDYYNNTYGTASAGFVTFAWGGGDDAVFKGVNDTTNLGGYQFRLFVLGTQVAAS